DLRAFTDPVPGRPRQLTSNRDVRANAAEVHPVIDALGLQQLDEVLNRRTDDASRIGAIDGNRSLDDQVAHGLTVDVGGRFLKRNLIDRRNRARLHELRETLALELFLGDRLAGLHDDTLTGVAVGIGV